MGYAQQLILKRPIETRGISNRIHSDVPPSAKPVLDRLRPQRVQADFGLVPISSTGATEGAAQPVSL
jgi:hypothetical protein